MASTAQDPGAEVVLSGLAQEIIRLPLGKALTLAEFALPGVTVWKVRPDGTGIPRVRYWRYEWPSLRAWDDLLSEGELLDRIRPEDEAHIMLARTGLQASASQADQNARHADRAFAIAREKFPHALAFSPVASVDDLLAEATARVPLPASLWYELVVLRRHRSGGLELTAQQLFLPEARRGDIRPFTVRCAASDAHGTTFAVVARDAALSFELVSMASAQIIPGIYEVTATLLRPGLVRFDGLSAELRADDRSWLDIRAALPDRLEVIGPAHLIIAVDRCGSAGAVQARIDRVGELVDQVRDTAGPVTCSLLTYASHSHDRRTTDEPVTVHAWRENKVSTLETCLRTLRGRDPAPTLYPRAAQVECMLAEVARRLHEPDAEAAGRPVLVTIGDKSAFPHRVDPQTGIIPCPQRNDWRTLIRGLAEDHQGMAFGAIRDDDDERQANPASRIWELLGTDGTSRLDIFDARRFAVGLGLRSAATQTLPLPLAVSEGAD